MRSIMMIINGLIWLIDSDTMMSTTNCQSQFHIEINKTTESKIISIIKPIIAIQIIDSTIRSTIDGTAELNRMFTSKNKSETADKSTVASEAIVKTVSKADTDISITLETTTIENALYRLIYGQLKGDLGRKISNKL